MNREGTTEQIVTFLNSFGSKNKAPQMPLIFFLLFKI